MDGYLPSGLMGLTPKKSFGQNFLVDEKVVADLVAAADLPEADSLTKTDVVVEVGAGTGVVTKELAKRAGKVLTFELDRDLIPVLENNLSGFDNIEIVNEDFLKSAESILLLFERSEKSKVPERSDGFLHSSIQSTQFKIVGSIPYQITSPLIHKLLTLEPSPSLVVLLIQKEVAGKITARPPKATYLSNIVKLLGKVEIVHPVPKTAFWPVPAVDGTIIKIVCSRSTLCCLPEVDFEDFQKFLHRGFRNPRKMLRTKFNTADLEKCGITPTRRAQTLEFDKWLKLYEWYN